MSTINKQILIGNLGNDPETIVFDNGGKITKFSLATSEKYTKKDTGEKIVNTEWHNIVCNGITAENAEKYLKKGSKVYIEGRTKHRSYEQDGIKKYITEVYVREMTFLTSNITQNQESNNKPKDDLPF